MRYALITLVFGLFVSAGFAHPQMGADQANVVPQESAQQYFPLGVFGQNTDKERQYASFLAAMREPSLFEIARKSEITEYRLLLPLRDRALSFRLELLVDGTGEFTMTRVILDSGKPHSVVVKDRVPIRAERVREFVALVQKADFWKSETEEPRDKAKHGTESIQWVLEGITNSVYHVVERATKDPDFARVCRFLMILAID